MGWCDWEEVEIDVHFLEETNQPAPWNVFGTKGLVDTLETQRPLQVPPYAQQLNVRGGRGGWPLVGSSRSAGSTGAECARRGAQLQPENSSSAGSRGARAPWRLSPGLWPQPLVAWGVEAAWLCPLCTSFVLVSSGGASPTRSEKDTLASHLR